MSTASKIREWIPEIHLKNVLIGVLGSAIVAFGIYNIHDVADITEGGILGLNLLFEYWLSISPAVTNLVLTIICFAIGWKFLGKEFIVYSAFFTGGFSVFYRIFESFTPHLFPQIANNPWLAAVVGSLFVGIGVGLSVREGGAQCGDDAVAMTFHHVCGVKISVVYLCSDLTVLLLSLTYIPWLKILSSLLTVVLSGQMIEFITRIGVSKEGDKTKTEEG